MKKQSSGGAILKLLEVLRKTYTVGSYFNKISESATVLSLPREYVLGNFQNDFFSEYP